MNRFSKFIEKIVREQYGGGKLSAIFGVVGTVGRDELDAMAARLSHKGAYSHVWSPEPGVWLGEVRNTSRTRSEDDCIAFSGQLYVNWREIAGSAEQQHFLQRDLAQRRIVAEAVQRDGIACTHTLDGHFGIASWDAPQRRLLLTVDRVNYENIYFTQTPDRFAFASEYKALLALEDVRPAPDPDAFLYSIATLLPNYNGSMCRGVGRVRYGHTLIVTCESRCSVQFFKPNCVADTGRQAHFATGLRHELLHQVETLLSHHDRIAITLSGGLDSVGLLSLMRHAFPGKTIASYTIGNGPEDAELTGARIGAEYFGTEHHEYVFDPASLVEDLPKIVWLAEEFASREESIMQYQVESQIIPHERVLTGGHGADMIFGGMPRHRLIRMAESLPFARRPMTELYQQTQSGLPPRTFCGRLCSYLLYRGTNIEPPQVTGANGPARVYEPRNIADMLNDLIGGFHPYHYHSAFYSLSPIEIVMPFMTLPIMNYSMRIPTRYKVGFRKQKMVLREALVPFIPKAMRNRGKAIQRAKRDTVLSDVLETLAEKLLSVEDVACRGLVAPAYVYKLRQRPADGIYKGDQLTRLWMLVCAELWCRTFVDHRGQPYGFDTKNLWASTPRTLGPASRGADLDTWSIERATVTSGKSAP
jgi:asparagine synthase (glutamine-hydrolysing)